MRVTAATDGKNQILTDPNRLGRVNKQQSRASTWLVKVFLELSHAPVSIVTASQVRGSE